MDVMNRPSWDQIWIEFVYSIARRSTDEKFKVGAVIVTEDNTQVLSVGYNGDHKGGSNKRESPEQGKSGFLHAEINALLKCDFNNPKKKKMYLTFSPCRMCAKAIINADINEVIFSELYPPSKDTIDFLKEFGVIVRQYKKQEL